MSFTIGEFRKRVGEYEARSADVYNLHRVYPYNKREVEEPRVSEN